MKHEFADYDQFMWDSGIAPFDEEGRTPHDYEEIVCRCVFCDEPVTIIVPIPAQEDDCTGVACSKCGILYD